MQSYQRPSELRRTRPSQNSLRVELLDVKFGSRSLTPRDHPCLTQSPATSFSPDHDKAIPRSLRWCLWTRTKRRDPLSFATCQRFCSRRDSFRAAKVVRPGRADSTRAKLAVKLPRILKIAVKLPLAQSGRGGFKKTVDIKQNRMYRPAPSVWRYSRPRLHMSPPMQTRECPCGPILAQTSRSCTHSRLLQWLPALTRAGLVGAQACRLDQNRLGRTDVCRRLVWVSPLLNPPFWTEE